MSEPKIEYANGKPYLILWRDTERGLTDPCAFCSRRHQHGLGDGHRIAHCSDADGISLFHRPVTRTIKGVKVSSDDGYFLRTRTEATK